MVYRQLAPRERERKQRRWVRRRRKNTAKSSCIFQNSLQSSLTNNLESISNITCDCMCVCVCYMYLQWYNPCSPFYTTNALVILQHRCTHHFTQQTHSPFYTTSALTILHNICTHHFTAQVHLLFYTTSSLTILHHKCAHHLTQVHSPFYTTSALIIWHHKCKHWHHGNLSSVPGVTSTMH